MGLTDKHMAYGDDIELGKKWSFYNEGYENGKAGASFERKTGKWINHRKDDGHNIADCDQCGNAIQWFDGDEIPRYCCMCGAYMRGESDG